LNRFFPAAKALVATTTDAAQVVKQFAMRRKEDATDATAKALDAFIPQIKTAIARVEETSAFRAVKSGAQNDDFMRKLFGAAYECLPRPVQRFVSEEKFVTFCMERRQKLIGGAGERTS
jgi:hypothetical protein